MRSIFSSNLTWYEPAALDSAIVARALACHFSVSRTCFFEKALTSGEGLNCNGVDSMTALDIPQAGSHTRCCTHTHTHTRARA